LVVPRVVEGPNFHVYVYAESSSPHKLAHCQVRWTDGSDIQVTLTGLNRVAGERELTRTERELIAQHLDELVAKWQELNPER
jgi:hypothetical protein